jgi:tRNA 2-thiouridine synthesizing protein B
MLHLIFQAQVDSAVLDRIAVGDVAVFLENGVLGILQQGRLSDALNEKLLDSRLYALSEDMAVRGIHAFEIVAGIEIIDYAGLVQLTVENSPVQSWC